MSACFGLMMSLGLIWGIACGKGAQTAIAMTAAGGEAIETAIALAGGFALWCGLMAVAREAGAIKLMERVMRPILGRIFPSTKESSTLEAISMNLSANMLGLGNAATPMGMEAMRCMAKTCTNGCASDDMCMFLIINASSVQLLPTSIMTIRAALGSADPGAILVPTLLASAASTVVGALLAKTCARASNAYNQRSAH